MNTEASATPTASSDVTVRALEDVDLDDIVRIDELITGHYRPDTWEERVTYYLRRNPDGALVAESEGEVVGFMLGDIRGGEFGLDELTGWIEVLGVDPGHRGKAIGRHLATTMFTHFQTEGAQVVRTMVDETMDGIERFFLSLGFAPAPLKPFVKRL
ncbi:MAG: GNAT family N-acetyltransferase [Acidobacteriota bacterium]